MPKPLSPGDAAVETVQIMSECAAAIKQAIMFASMKHGLLRNPERSMVILMEEVGEAAKEIVELKTPGAKERAAHELMQVAAVAMRLAVQLKEDRWRTE